MPNPFVKAKKLIGVEIDTYRFRIGDYRAIFKKDPISDRFVILVILKVAHRKEVYRK